MRTTRQLKPILLAFATLVMASNALAQTVARLTLDYSVEYNTDRPGSDYRNFELPVDNLDLCAAQCQRESQCKAWTYVKRGVQGTFPRCWLKNSVPPPIAADYAISGVRFTSQYSVVPGASFTGTWSANDFGTIKLTQTGNRVSGTYSATGGGTLDGTVQGSVWQGGWVNNDGRRGTFRVEMTADGMGFKGAYETTGFSGVFNATRS